MNKKNLIITAVGDNSYHKEWFTGDCNFDAILVYYGDNDDIYNEYKKDAIICIKQKGQYYPLMKKIISENLDIINNYDYVWLPDDDLSISTEDINRLFNICSEYDIFICQPSVKSEFKLSHHITEHHPDSFLRYTNFVEGMAPLFKKDILLQLYDDFHLSDSGWGLDLTWHKRIGSPNNKIAIIDNVVVIHKRPTGSDYSRLQKQPIDELNLLVSKYDVKDPMSFFEYSRINKNINTEQKGNITI